MSTNLKARLSTPQLFTYSIFLGLSLCSAAFSQEKGPVSGQESVTLALSGFSEAENHCARIALLQADLSQKSKEEVVTELSQTLEQLRTESEESFLTKRQRRLFKQSIHDLEMAIQSENPHTLIRDMLSYSCKAAQVGSGALIRTSALALSTLTSVITAPIRFSAKFGIGVFTRKLTPNQGPGYVQLTGSKGGITGWLGVVYQTYRVAFVAGSSYLLGAYALVATESQIDEVCSKNENLLSEKTKRFCENHRLIKKKEFEITEIGEEWGVKVGKQLLKLIDFKPDVRNEALCQKSIRKQFHIAKRSRERLTDKLSKTSKDTQVFIDLEPSTDCVNLKAVFKGKIDDSVLRDKTDIDGFSVEYLTEEEFKELEAERRKLTEKEPTLTTNQEICQEVVRNRKKVQYLKQMKKQKPKYYVEIAEYLMNSKKFAEMNFQKLEVPDSSLFQASTQLNKKRNIIAIIAPSPEELEDFSALKEKQQTLTAIVKAENKKLKQLIQVADVPACLEMQEELDYQPSRIKASQKGLSELNTLNRIEEYRALAKIAHKADKIFSRTKLDWEIVDLVSLNQIFDWTTRGEVANLLLVSHG